jgi:glutathione S-transferase
MKLLVFPHSHFCEKARWALDAKGIKFQPVAILPGFHIVHVRRYAAKTSVPVLLDNNEVVQGAGEIIDYLERHFPESPLTPSVAGDREDCLAIESMADERLGEDLRQILYSGLLAYPGFVRFCFTHSMSPLKKVVFSLSYPLLRRRIHDEYVFSIEAVESTKDRKRSVIPMFRFSV